MTILGTYYLLACNIGLIARAQASAGLLRRTSGQHRELLGSALTGPGANRYSSRLPLSESSRAYQTAPAGSHCSGRDIYCGMQEGYAGFTDMLQDASIMSYLSGENSLLSPNSIFVTGVYGDRMSLLSQENHYLRGAKNHNLATAKPTVVLKTIQKRTTEPGESCSTIAGTKCQLPFIFRGIERNSCITEGDMLGKAWCSTNIDSRMHHVSGAGNWGHCDMIQTACSRIDNRSVK